MLSSANTSVVVFVVSFWILTALGVAIYWYNLRRAHIRREEYWKKNAEDSNYGRKLLSRSSYVDRLGEFYSPKEEPEDREEEEPSEKKHKGIISSLNSLFFNDDNEDDDYDFLDDDDEDFEPRGYYRREYTSRPYERRKTAYDANMAPYRSRKATNTPGSQDVTAVIGPPQKSKDFLIRVHMIKINGQDSDQDFYLGDQESNIIGRGTECTLSIPDKAISRKNTEILYKEGDIYIRDLESTNHTYINDIPITSGEVVRVSGEDEIRVGNTIFTIHKPAGSVKRDALLGNRIVSSNNKC